MKALIPKLAGRRILVIGDVILDEYLFGNAARMSREAPVPVLEFESRELIPGGASNPAANITALGSSALQVAIVGDDEFADQLRLTLQSHHIDVSGIIATEDRPTTVKTRVMAQMGLRFPQQVARLDRLSRAPITAETELAVLNAIQQHLHDVDAVLFSDYGGGLLTPTLVDTIRAEANTNTLLTADTQGQLDKYRGCTFVKCNAHDAQDFLGTELHTDADYADAARTIYDRLDMQGSMVITRGADGATLATADETIHCPAPVVADVYDTVGAGDTAIALATLALVAGSSYYQAVMLANYGSGLVVRRVGNYTPSPDELLQAIADWD